MQQAWAEIEDAFTGALLDRDRAIPAQLSGRPLRIRDGFGVYQTSYRVNLVDALRNSFPVTAQLVGEEFFEAMAGEFAVSHPPRSPVLIEYGDELPAFIAGFAPAASVPYLSEVARLEVAWVEAYHALEDTAITMEELRDVAAERLARARLSPHPSLRLVRSPYPVASIWTAHRSPREGSPPLHWVAEDVMVVRPEAEVAVFTLAPGNAVFIEALRAEHTIEQAASLGCAASADFDPGKALLEFVRCGAATALRL